MRYTKHLSAAVLILLPLLAAAQANKDTTAKAWFAKYDFDAATFKQAPREFGPFTRWWLPGNDITSEELQREVKMFADNGFAGVEVQPLTMGLNPNAPKEQLDRIFSWDTPSFYEHLRAIMQQAQRSNVTVDMNGGSGWPLGGSFVGPDESMKTLAVSDTLIAGGGQFSGPLPAPHNHDAKAQGMMAMAMGKPDVDNKWAVLLSLVAAKVVKKESGQTLLDASTIVNLTAKVTGNSINWQAPAGGEWQLVASWNVPTGEGPSLIASRNKNYVIDHFDPKVVAKAYDYLLGGRTGLPAYYHNPLRAIFNDSYEFHTDRMISPDFLPVFKAKNGYDITPYLSAVFQKGYDHPAYLAASYPGAKPPFSFNSAESWRMMYDYDQAVNETFKKNFIEASDKWLEKRGMLHRTQAYGFAGDLIGNAGAADIPEAEQLYAEGSEGFLKLVTSGAHLNNRPVVTQESFVSIYRAEMTTPQKIKMWADKSLACGINQFIYHGTPYKYNNGEYGKEGWNTWSSPFVPYINFSTGMNESDPFWKDIKTLNQYLARCQYALRSGKPKTDVLIYMPFINLTEDQLVPNPAEILYLGYFEGVEPAISGQGIFEAPKTPINIWYTKLWAIINALEEKGISWEFVNDGSLQKASISSGKIDIEGNKYQTLILANLPYINLGTAKAINALSKQGMSIWTIGSLPQKQPSYLHYAANDLLAKQLLEDAAKQANTKAVAGEMPLNTIAQKIRFANSADFSRQLTREMEDGSQIKFIWNKSGQWQTISLALSNAFASSYWLNPENGVIVKNSGKTINYYLPPYGSVILYASASKPVDQQELSPAPASETEAKEILNIGNWNLKVGDISLQGTALADWRTINQLKFTSGEGDYTASFNIKEVKAGRHYFINLGKVFYTAAIKINGVDAGKRLFAPYSLEITNLLKAGDNSIEVIITTSRRNGFIGEAVKGNPQYQQFKGKENTTVPEGLVGPVVIKEL